MAWAHAVERKGYWMNADSDHRQLGLDACSAQSHVSALYWQLSSYNGIRYH